MFNNTRSPGKGGRKQEYNYATIFIWVPCEIGQTAGNGVTESPDLGLISLACGDSDSSRRKASGKKRRVEVESKRLEERLIEKGVCVWYVCFQNSF